jgi:hypothetical protein
MQANQGVSLPRRSQLTVRPSAAHAMRDLSLPKPPKRGDHGLTTTGDPGNLGSDQPRMRRSAAPNIEADTAAR